MAPDRRPNPKRQGGKNADARLYDGHGRDPGRHDFGWDDTPDGPDPQTLLTALPGRPVLLRECDDGQPLTLTDGQLPEILVPYNAEHLLDMAVALLSLDMIVTVDGPVAHLAANLGLQNARVVPIRHPLVLAAMRPRRGTLVSDRPGGRA